MKRLSKVPTVLRQNGARARIDPTIEGPAETPPSKEGGVGQATVVLKPRPSSSTVLPQILERP